MHDFLSFRTNTAEYIYYTQSTPEVLTPFMRKDKNDVITDHSSKYLFMNRKISDKMHDMNANKKSFLKKWLLWPDVLYCMYTNMWPNYG